MNDSIKKMLRLIDKELMITEFSYEIFHKEKTLIIHAILSPDPRACRSCGSTVVDGNGKAIVVKNGKKEIIVRFEQYNPMPMIIRLKKQRYTCKTVVPIGLLKAILSAQDVQLRILSDIKLLLY